MAYEIKQQCKLCNEDIKTTELVLVLHSKKVFDSGSSGYYAQFLRLLSSGSAKIGTEGKKTVVIHSKCFNEIVPIALECKHKSLDPHAEKVPRKVKKVRRKQTRFDLIDEEE